jgi:tetratricopeptide (TPR) repeat protein
MKRIHIYRTQILTGLFLLGIFFVSQLPLRDYDIWFHMKAGEYLLAHGLTFTDPFSHVASGREWIHFEWLFQIIVYLLSLAGLWILPPFAALFVTILHGILILMYRRIFRLGIIPSVILAYLFFVSTYEYNTVRPHVLAYTFLTATLYLILERIFNKKRWVFLTPLFTIIWTNVHSTGFLSWGMCVTFGLLYLAKYFLKKDANDRMIAKDLLILTLINALITISPPMGFADYRLLWRFFQNREFLGVFVAEWAPTHATDNVIGIYVYSTLVGITSLSILALSIRTKKLLANIWVVPFLIMGAMGFTAARNVFPGTLGMYFVLGWVVYHYGHMQPRWLNPTSKRIVIVFLLSVFLCFASYFLIQKRKATSSERRYYPVQSSEFAKRYLEGNMFNDYTYGGYVMYATYPQLKVLIDGRAEVYLCCEMADYIQLAANKNLPDDEYVSFLSQFMDRYDINFAIISTQKHNVMRRISYLLQHTLDWALVFWDDDSQVFVKRDGVNDAIIQQLEAKVASPYMRNPFPKGQEEQAIAEYERMDSVAKSARTSNALGYLLMLQGKFDEAKIKFLEAIDKDPTFDSPYMNLGELAVRDANLQEALLYYYKAQNISDDRGLTYVRLGELEIQANNNTEKARQIWTLGARKTVDEDMKKKLTELLSTLQDQK